MIGATPVALFLREHAAVWATLKAGDAADSAEAPADGSAAGLNEDARRVLDALRGRGASFVHELAAANDLDETRVRTALGELVSAGLVASDGFGGLRSIIRPSSGARTFHAGRSLRANVAGRWSLINGIAGRRAPSMVERETAVDAQARSLLLRYGVVFRRLLAREANVAPWRELTRVYRRLEARGEIRGGRFVSGMSGEQFAMPAAIERLREIRRTPPNGHSIVISAADPLNLAGIVTTGDRVRAVAGTRVLYRDGVPLAAMEGDYVRPLTMAMDVAPETAVEVATALVGRPMPAILSGFVGRS